MSEFWQKASRLSSAEIHIVHQTLATRKLLNYCPIYWSDMTSEQ